MAPAIPTHTIRTILFDLDGTLRTQTPSSHEVFTRFITKAGYELAPASTRQAMYWAHYYWAGSPELEADLAEYGHNTPMFWQNYVRSYLEAFGCPPAIVDAAQPCISGYFNEQYHPTNQLLPGAVETLDSLRAAGYVLGLVTNRDRSCQEELDTLGVGEYFPITVVAGLVNSWKPDPAIFEHALAAAGTQAAETIYVGDNYFADIIGAQRAGIHPVLLDPEGVFPDAGCTILARLDELVHLLRHD